MINLQIISGTDRPGSYALRIANYLQGLYESMDVAADILDLQAFPLSEVAGGPYHKHIPEVSDFIAPAVEADGVVIVCPEYNGGYPGILKLFIDYLPYPGALRKKPICFVGESKGAFGGMRAVEQLQQVVGYRNAHVFPERVFISQVDENFDDTTGIHKPSQQALLEDQVQNFVMYLSNFSFVTKEP